MPYQSCLLNFTIFVNLEILIEALFSCKIVEANERLVAEPELVRTHPGTQGFIAMVLPKIPDGLKELRERLECVEGEEQDMNIKENEGVAVQDDIG